MINLWINSINDISWETVVAILGALAWLPWLFDKFVSAKVYGNVISYILNSGEFNKKKGLMYFFKLSVSCINKNFNIKTVNIYVKYSNRDQWFSGSIFWARTSIWVIENGKPSKRLTLPNDNFLGFINVLEKDKSNFYYLTFLVQGRELEEFEKIKFEFINHKAKKIGFEILHKEIDFDKILFEDKIWS